MSLSNVGIERRATALVVVGVIAAVIAGQGQALARTQATLGIEILPRSASLVGSQPERIQILVRNSGETPARHIHLHWAASDGLKLVTSKTSELRLKSGDFHRFNVRVRRAAGVELPGQVAFKVTYRNGRTGARKFVTQQLEVAAGTPERADAVAKLEIRTALSSLSENRSGRLYLLVTNVTDVPITASRGSEMKPEFIDLAPVEETVQVLPGDTGVLPFDVEANERVQPGKHLIVVRVDLRWERGGRALTASLVASHEVSVEIFGESAILGALAIPTVLLLPGALVVLAFSACLMILWKKDALPLDPTKALFWFIAIPTSFVAAALFQFVGGQNYLLAYGFIDLVWLWIFSTVLGAALFLIWVVARWFSRRWFLPAETDDPLKVLQKLAHRFSRVTRPRVKLDRGEVKPGAFLLQRKPNSSSGQWVGPRVVLHFSPTSDLRRAVERHLVRGGSIRQVFKRVRKADRNEVRLRFDPASALHGPHLEEKVVATGTEDLFVVTRTGFGPT